MKRRILTAVLAACTLLSGIAFAPTAAAAGPITIQGNVYDKSHNPVPGVTVVAWCGGINFFGGSGVTDASGHYVIKTDSDACPFDNELTVTTDIDYDGQSDGARHTQVHTQTVISITLGNYTSVAVPEYDWVTAGGALLVGAGAISFVRRRQGHL